MLPRIVAIGALVAAGCLYAPPVVSQTQKQTQTLGGRTSDAGGGGGARKAKKAAKKRTTPKRDSGSRQ